MTDKDVKELLGHMVLQLRAGEMAVDARDKRIAELEAEVEKLTPKNPESDGA